MTISKTKVSLLLLCQLFAFTSLLSTTYAVPIAKQEAIDAHKDKIMTLIKDKSHEKSSSYQYAQALEDDVEVESLGEDDEIFDRASHDNDLPEGEYFDETYEEGETYYVPTEQDPDEVQAVTLERQQLLRWSPSGQPVVLYHDLEEVTDDEPMITAEATVKHLDQKLVLSEHGTGKVVHKT